LDRENEAIADCVFDHFPAKAAELREIEALLEELPGRPPLPDALAKLSKALEDCRRSRQVEETVIAVKRRLDALRDGLEQLGIFRADLRPEATESVREAARIKSNQLRQLEATGTLDDELEEASQAIRSHLSGDRPWRDIASLEASLDCVRTRYREYRRHLIGRQASESEAAMGQVKTREGYERLDAETADKVLQPIRDAVYDTTEDALAPALLEMDEGFRSRLARGEEEANERLDRAVEAVIEKPVVKVEARIHNRVLAEPGELKNLLRELEDRLGPPLEEGKRVRIV